MKNFILAAAFVPALAFGGAAAAHDVKCPTVSQADVERQFTTFNAAWATKDPDKVAALFTKDAVLLATVSNKPRTTPEGVRDYFVSFLKNSPQATIDSSSVKIDCGTASRVGTWTVNLTDPATGGVRAVKARYSFVYKYDGGVWKIDHLHSSMMPEPN